MLIENAMDNKPKPLQHGRQVHFGGVAVGEADDVAYTFTTWAAGIEDF